MKEDTYRLMKSIFLAVAVIGFLVVGFRWAENGSYVQYDKRMEYSPDGKAHMASPSYMVIDTRTGSLSTPTP